MKKYCFLFTAALICCTFSGCNNFLDTENLTTKNGGNFPVNETDMDQMLTGVYSTLGVGCGANHTYFFVAQLASDDCFGGGGQDDKMPQAFDHLMTNDDTSFDKYWKQRYTGINRANSFLEHIDIIQDETQRNQKKGEALFIRAFSYFELTQMFEKVPIVSQMPGAVSEAQTAPAQASVDDIYKRIATDLKEACEIMPSNKWNTYQFGTITRWDAEALLARVYLFYTGFYNKTSLPTEDGTVDKQYVVSKLDDCIKNSGHSLLPDYRSLWPYTNSATKVDYSYASDAPDWAKDGDNPEQMFALNFTYVAGWPGDKLAFVNFYCQQFGMRGNGDKSRFEDTYPFGQGWGMAPVNPGLWNEWEADEPNDKRRDASIFQVSDKYKYGADNQMEESGMWQKKIITTSCHENGKRISFCSSSKYWGDGVASDWGYSNCQDLTLIRFADVLLMQSELTEDVQYMNLVRARAGLQPLASYSLDLLQKERRHEFAFEGLRWGDIRRWHIAEAALAGQVGQIIHNRGSQTVMNDQGVGYVARYKATRGFFPIPNAEVTLSNGTWTQNAGWDDASSHYDSWK